MKKILTQLKRISPALAVVAVVLMLPNSVYADFGFEAAAQGILWTVINVFFGWIVYASGSLLDYSINELVIGFGSFYSTSGLGFSINSLWTIVRDIFNLTFIFGLVFIGFKMIFNSSDSNAKRMLGSLILAALLVNFSLFITKLVIDFANIAAMQFASGFTNNGVQAAQVSAGFMSIFGLTGIWNTGGSLANFGGGAGWGYIFGALMLYVVAGFVFLSGALLLVVRFVVLNIYMVLSPLMFLGFVFPGFQNVTTTYWRGFLSQAFFAPAYIIMIYFSYQILVNLKGAAGAGNLGQLFGTARPAPATFEAVFPMFIMTAVFMIASLVVAQKMGMQGASSSLAIGKRLSGGARRAVTGATVGAVGRKAAQGLNSAPVTRLNARLNNSKWGSRAVAVGSLGTLTSRNRQGIIEGSKKAKFGGNYSLADNEQFSRDQGMRDSRILAGARSEAAITAGTDSEHVAALAAIRKRQAEAAATGGSPMTTAETDTLRDLEKIEAEMQSAINGLTTSMMEDMTDKQLAAIRTNLSSTQVESLMKSDKISESSKNAITEARQDVIHKLVGGGRGSLTATMTSELTKLSTDQIETMGSAWIQENSHLLSASQMDDIKKSKKFTDGQRQSFSVGRTTKQKAAVTSARGGSFGELESIFTTTDGVNPPKERKPKDIANLGPDALLDRHSIKYITPAVLAEIGSNNTLDLTQRKALVRLITASSVPQKAELTRYLATTHAVSNGWV
jgi:hypothetical protein